MNGVIQLAKHFGIESEKVFSFQRILRGEKGREQQLLESLHYGGSISGTQGEARAGLVEMLCASLEKDREEREREAEKGKRHYIKTM